MAGNSIPAVAYYRMSTDRQETSIPDQRDAVEKLARKGGYKIVREYTDEGISGDDTEKRAGFRKMLADATKLGDFQAVLCWDQDRFGRFDPLEAGYWIKPLRDAGVYLETVGQGRIDWEDFAGRIIYAVQQEGKHAYLRDLSRNTTRGMLAKARRGEWLGGPTPYGYRLNDHKRLEAGDPSEVATVRWLFREYLARDIGLQRLAGELNERGVTAPAGVRKDGRPALWSDCTVRDVLTRPSYCGDTVWNRRPSGAYHGVCDGEVAASTRPKRKARRNEPGQWVVFQDTHDPLIDRDTFGRVRQKLVERQEGRSSASKSDAFLFTGLLRCGRCGAPLYGQHQRLKTAGQRYRRYVCGRYLKYRRRGCHSNAVIERDVLDVVLATLEQAFLAPQNLDALRAEVERQERAERLGAEPAAAALDRRIAALTTKIDRGMERWLTAPPSLVQDAGAKLEQWRKEREELQDRRRSVAKPTPTLPALDAVVGQITAGVATLRKRADKARPDEMRALLRAMLDKVEIDFREEAFGPKRRRGVPIGGRLYLRDDAIMCRPVDIGCPRPGAITTGRRSSLDNCPRCPGRNRPSTPSRRKPGNIS
jgi:DNA invertase Pin-like site-specific DNA recombinase